MREVDVPAVADDLRLMLVTDLAVALHRAGVPSHRLEGVAVDVARGLGLQVQVLALPTALTVASGVGEASRVQLRRVEPADPDLAKLVALDELSNALSLGRLSAAEGRVALEQIVARGPRWSVPTGLVTWGLASGAAAVLFGGRWTDVWVSAALGVACAGLVAVLTVRPAMLRAAGMLAAMSVAAVSRWLVDGGAHLDPGVVTVSALIVLLPGYSFTVGMVELGSGHLVSGVARTAAAAISLLLLVLGVALGGGGFLGSTPSTEPALAAWVEPVAIVLAPLCFGVLLGARARDLPWVLLGGLVGLAAARLGDVGFGAPTGAFFGALAVGLCGNLAARWFGRPAALVQVPGVLLLVPGSVGFRSLIALLGGDVLAGVDHGFHMALTASALAAGLVLAPTLVPPGRPT